MIFKLPKLPYDYADLEPFIDKETMVVHHTKHHQTYIDNLNKALEGQSELQKMTLKDLLANISKVPEGIKQTVINNAGGHANHLFFWEILCPSNSDGTVVPSTGKFINNLNSAFGDIDKFKEDFTNKAMSVFGSGWAFLIMTPQKKLILKRHSFQNSPLMYGNIPILGIDLWEHAYYLKYKNRKADYVKAWWSVVNWKQVEINFKEAAI